MVARKEAPTHTCTSGLSRGPGPALLHTRLYPLDGLEEAHLQQTAKASDIVCAIVSDVPRALCRLPHRRQFKWEHAGLYTSNPPEDVYGWPQTATVANRNEKH